MPIVIRTTAAVTAAITLLLVLPATAEAQRPVSIGASAGYLTAGGGDPAWDDAHGPAAALALGLRLGAHSALVLEGGFQRFPTVRQTIQCGAGDCLEPQVIEREVRQSGITVDLLFRLHRSAGRVRPYGVIGIGHATARPREHVVRTALDGRVISDDRFGSDSQAGGLVLGGGIELGNPAGGIAFTAGLRGRVALTGYDGGPTTVRMLSGTVGVVLR